MILKACESLQERPVDYKTSCFGPNLLVSSRFEVCLAAPAMCLTLCNTGSLQVSLTLNMFLSTSSVEKVLL